jgi:hypothetical protein
MNDWWVVMPGEQAESAHRLRVPMVIKTSASLAAVGDGMVLL